MAVPKGMLSRDKHRRMMEDLYEVPYHEITKEMILDRRELKKTIPYDWRE